ncbi:hypothetical protein TRFO_25251 [Tritrichomonas foetus]|uniref:Uncharacterized protein n=1 Tax=Tritrichomonas foetus TaxID=1144522 RepID=A0A1J4K6P1_9EUKA|nr:hypothetical protein TRFO_25251 [Tritrichomonas foetus]|eukprot:OHT06642.1 hypothetical protein TRFO_25251 [Tritrichomonas foetus]
MKKFLPKTKPSRIKVFYSQPDMPGSKVKMANLDSTINDFLKTALKRTAYIVTYIPESGTPIELSHEDTFEAIYNRFSMQGNELKSLSIENDNNYRAYIIQSPNEPVTIDIDTYCNSETDTRVIFEIDGNYFPEDEDITKLQKDDFYLLTYPKNVNIDLNNLQKEQLHQLMPMESSEDLNDLYLSLSVLWSNKEIQPIIGKAIFNHSTFLPLKISAYNLFLNEGKFDQKFKNLYVCTFIKSLLTFRREGLSYSQIFNILLTSKLPVTLMNQINQEFAEKTFEHIKVQPLPDVPNDSHLPFTFYKPLDLLYNKKECLCKFEDNKKEKTIKCKFIKANENNPNNFDYFDPDEGDLKTHSFFTESVITNPEQVTAIFIDTSGSMLTSFCQTAKKQYEAAQEIANKLLESIQIHKIVDPQLVYTTKELSIVDRPICIQKPEICGTTKIWDRLDEFYADILQKFICKKHVVIISDGEDTFSSLNKREEIAKILSENQVIVDSIILTQDEYTKDPYGLSMLTGGVAIYPKDLESAFNFVTNEPFFNLKLRTQVPTKAFKNDFFMIGKTFNSFQREFKQLKVQYLSFYTDFDKGIFKPLLLSSLIKDKNSLNIRENSIIREIGQLYAHEKENNIYAFLINDDDDSKLESLTNWCIFTKLQNSELYFQIKITFPEMFPYSNPIFRIISKPDAINHEFISPHGFIYLDKLSKSENITVYEIIREIQLLDVKINDSLIENCLDPQPFSEVNNTISWNLNASIEKNDK